MAANNQVREGIDPAGPSSLDLWVDDLQNSPLGDATILLVRGLHMWGFLIGQILWMAAPLIGEHRVSALARTLEDDEAMDALYARVVDRGVVKGSVQGR